MVKQMPRRDSKGRFIKKTTPTPSKDTLVQQTSSRPEEHKTNRADSKSRGPQVRHWCFTDFTTKNFRNWKSFDLLSKGIRCMVYQLEQCPKTNQLHVQGYVEFYKVMRLGQVKRALESTSIHLEPRKGTRNQAYAYACKEDTRVIGTEPVYLGVFDTKQGYRSDLAMVTDLVRSGANEREIMEQCPTQHIKYTRGIQRQIYLRNQHRVNAHRKVDVHVIWGDTRTGKTRFVYDKFGPANVYTAKFNENGKLWMNGYSGQKVLLINEFYGQARLGFMLELLDNYVQQLETKGGFIVTQWDTVYITSNKHPQDWYDTEKIPLKPLAALAGRFKSVTNFANKSLQRTPETLEEVYARFGDAQFEKKYLRYDKVAGPSITPPPPSPSTDRTHSGTVSTLYRPFPHVEEDPFYQPPPCSFQGIPYG